MQGSDTIVLLSGGIDSAVCCQLLRTSGHRVRGLHLDFGQAARVQERDACERLVKHLQIPLQFVTVDLGRNFHSGEITGRNAFLAFAALMQAESALGAIVLGIHSGVPYYDCSEPFAERLDQLIRECSSGRFGFLAPLLRWTKSDIVSYARGHGIPLQGTYSCERGVTPPCGVCSSCLDRRAHNC